MNTAFTHKAKCLFELRASQIEKELKSFVLLFLDLWLFRSVMERNRSTIDMKRRGGREKDERKKFIICMKY